MKKILIVSGPTREHIDNIRFISNISSGKTGSFLAEFYSQKGYEVSQLYGFGSVYYEKSKLFKFISFQDLQLRIEEILSQDSFDAVIMCAAVSDYTPDEILIEGDSFKIEELDKIPSGKSFELKFKKNPKLIKLIKHYSRNKSVKVIGFKLTSNANEVDAQNAIVKLFSGDDVDYVIHNDLSGISEKQHVGRIFSSKKLISIFESKVAMANNLLKILEKEL